uniref:Uncharacterized protein n=1 Tax=Anguilla anguilla TaxID=7936 RepID=A0A0E9WNE8_ANGAN
MVTRSKIVCLLHQATPLALHTLCVPQKPAPPAVLPVIGPLNTNKP